MAEKKLTSLMDLMKEFNIRSESKSGTESDDESPPPPAFELFGELYFSETTTSSFKRIGDLFKPPLPKPRSQLVEVQEDEIKKVVVESPAEKSFFEKNNKVEIYAKKNTTTNGESSGYEGFCGGTSVSSSMGDSMLKCAVDAVVAEEEDAGNNAAA